MCKCNIFDVAATHRRYVVAGTGGPKPTKPVAVTQPYEEDGALQEDFQDYNVRLTQGGEWLLASTVNTLRRMVHRHIQISIYNIPGS